jgi:hypothetical protein
MIILLYKNIMIYLMARLIKKECKRPVELKVDKTGSIWILYVRLEQ